MELTMCLGENRLFYSHSPPFYFFFLRKKKEMDGKVESGQ